MNRGAVAATKTGRASEIDLVQLSPLIEAQGAQVVGELRAGLRIPTFLLSRAVGRQQGERMRRIGMILPASADDPPNQARVRAFLQGLALSTRDGAPHSAKPRGAYS